MKAFHKVLIAIVISLSAVFCGIGFANSSIDTKVMGNANLVPPSAVYTSTDDGNTWSILGEMYEGTAPIKTYSGWIGRGSFDTDLWESTDGKTIEQKIVSAE